MTSKAASEEVLGELHSKVARVMSGALESFDVAQREYIEDPTDKEAPVVSAPLLGVIAKFLNDNKVTCVPADSKELSDLEKRLKNKRRLAVGNVVHLVDE